MPEAGRRPTNSTAGSCHPAVSRTRRDQSEGERLPIRGSRARATQVERPRLLRGIPNYRGQVRASSTRLSSACVENHAVASTANAVGGERAETALFAVSVRSTAGVGRTTDTLRYLYAASPLQRLLQFYSKHHLYG